MGQIADDMIDGVACALCGCYFVTPESNIDTDEVELFEHGYPVACKSCWEEDCGYQKATADTL